MNTTLFAVLLLLVCTLQPGGLVEAKKKKSERSKSKGGKQNKTRGDPDGRRHWDKSGDGTDGKDYWGMPSPNPGWDKYYSGKCDQMLKCAASADLKCLKESAIPLCNLEMQETEGDRNVFAQALGVAAKEGQLKAVELLVNFPTKWWNKDMIVNEAGETVLMHAAANGRYEVVEWLLQQGADVRARSPNGESAEDLARTSESPGETLAVLHKMSRVATDKMLSGLGQGRAMSPAEFTNAMKAGAAVDVAENKTGLPPVALAAKYGMAEMVKMLAGAGADLEWRDPRTGHCVLHMACDRGHFNALVTLLEYGADPSVVTEQFEMDCLQLAAMNGRNGIVQAMLDHGNKYPEKRADPKRANYQGENALLMFTRQMYGAVGQQANIMKLLIDGGSDVNAKTADGTRGSPIFYSIDHSQPVAMEMLVAAGAQTNVVAVDEEDGGRPVGAFEQSVRSGCQKCAAWLIKNGHREEFEFTRQRSGARGLTALYAVVLQSWQDVAEGLIKDGTDPNVRNADMSTPLFAAALTGSKESVDMLVKAGANLEARNRDTETALFVAANNGKDVSLRALIAGGANVNAMDKSQTTALFRAAMNGHVYCVTELLEAGADTEQQGYSTAKRTAGGRAGIATLVTPAAVAAQNGHARVAEIIKGFVPIHKTEDSDLL